MVAYSFQKQFAMPILEGTKGGTIRANRKRHAHPGEELQLYTGMRTKHCRLIARKPCLAVTPISLNFKINEWVGIAGVASPIKGARSLDTFAVFDGFSDWASLREFWRETHDLAVGSSAAVFRGQHIRWLELPEALVA